MLARLAFVATFAVTSLTFTTSALAAPPEPLTRAVLGDGAVLVARPKVAGIELTFAPAPSAPRRWSMSLLAPSGASSRTIETTFPSDAPPLTVTLARPVKNVADGDLRILLEVSDASGREHAYVALLATYLEVPRLRVLGDSAVYAGTTYAPRVIATVSPGACVRAPCERPLEGAELSARLETRPTDAKKKSVTLATVRASTDATGSAALALPVPRDADGALAVVIEMTHADGIATVTHALKTIVGAKILLSTDKPIYQPGQRIHLRLLAREKGSGHAAGNIAATLIALDSKGNKVFQKKGKTSPEGVFAAELELATLVNLGRWRLTAKVGDDEVERTVEVKPYVLPKFKVELVPERTSYKPGELVKGTIAGRYFFGEPTRSAKVELTAETFDVQTNAIARLALTLDADGKGRWDFKLPTALVGTPLAQGAAMVALTARVTDTAGQVHEARSTLYVSENALRVTALPEAGRLVPGVDNAVYFIVTTPDGAPAPRAKVTIDGAIGRAPASVETDAQGVAEWHVTPVANLAFDVVVATPEGATARASIALATSPSLKASVLLRPKNVSPRGGERVDFEVFATGAVPHVFVDIVKDQQTLLTLSGPVRDGKAVLSTTLPPELFGTVLAHAYAIGDDMDVYGDTRPMVVRSADALNIDITADKTRWKPGEEATLQVRVTDRQGHPVLAALGLWAVDEAVFALSELHPGMEQVFFLLEQEIMKPKVEIHGFEPDTVFFPRVLPTPQRGPIEASDRPAKVLAAAAMPTFVHAFKKDSRDQVAATSRLLWADLMAAKVKRVRNELRAWIRESWRAPSGRELHRIARAAGIQPEVTRDWFGVPFRMTVPNSSEFFSDARLISAGPDATWNTSDDLSGDLELDALMQPVWDLEARREERLWTLKGGGRAFGVGSMAARGDGGDLGFGGVGLGGGGFALGAVGGVGAPSPRQLNVLKSQTRGGVIDSLEGGGDTPPQEAAGPRLREYFPETLYVNPLLLTDSDGRASLTIPLADSITTWRLSSLASTSDGRLGSSERGLEVFQDFFVDIAFPASLTRNDEVTVPLAVYNYLPEKQTVRLSLAADGGLQTRGATELEVVLGPNEVKGVDLPLFAKAVGNGRLTVTARGSKLSDAVRREVRIEPDGFPVTTTESGSVSDAIEVQVDVPENAIESANILQLKLYPGAFAQVVDGLENMLRMPSGCFEQTSSSTYPNILVLKYLRDAKKSKPELEATALRYLQAGWQRLVTYEVQGGGFSWFGNAPANQVLTSYGLMEFHDMAKVMDIDKNVIARTRQWVLGKQQSDGSWRPDASHLHEESWGDIQKSSLLVSAYITWSLAYTRPDRRFLEAPVQRGLEYLKSHLAEADDPYVLAYIANALAEAVADRSDANLASTLRQVLAKLASKADRPKDGKGLTFPTKLRTATYGSGESAQLEVTALSLRAFMRAQDRADLIKPGLDWLVSRKDSLGNWQTTQATIQVLQALIGSLSAQAEAVAGKVSVSINGKLVADAVYGADDFDVVRFIDGSRALVPGKNTIRVEPSKGMRPQFQLTATHFLPWPARAPAVPDAFDVKVSYDKTTLAQNDLATVRVEVRSNLPGVAEMGIVDVAVPPGFDVLTEDLERAVSDQTIQRFAVAGRQIILYVPVLDPKTPFVATFRVRARFPIKAMSGAARAYEYYNPDHSGLAAPEPIRVEAKR